MADTKIGLAFLAASSAPRLIFSRIMFSKSEKPGTKEVRAALRNALENPKEVVGVQGVFNMSATEHNGLDNRGRTMFTIKDGKWALATK